MKYMKLCALDKANFGPMNLDIKSILLHRILLLSCAPKMPS